MDAQAKPAAGTAQRGLEGRQAAGASCERQPTFSLGAASASSSAASSVASCSKTSTSLRR
jgi:hypothetical protein